MRQQQCWMDNGGAVVRLSRGACMTGCWCIRASTVAWIKMTVPQVPNSGGMGTPGLRSAWASAWQWAWQRLGCLGSMDKAGKGSEHGDMDGIARSAMLVDAADKGPFAGQRYPATANCMNSRLNAIRSATALREWRVAIMNGGKVEPSMQAIVPQAQRIAYH